MKTIITITPETPLDAALAQVQLREKDAQIAALREALVVMESAVSTCKEHCYSDGTVHHQSFNTLAMGEAQLAARNALSTSPPPVVPLGDVIPLIEVINKLIASCPHEAEGIQRMNAAFDAQ